MPFYFRRPPLRRAKNRYRHAVVTPIVVVSAGHLTLGGKTITFQHGFPVTAGHLTLAGRAVVLTLTTPLAKASLLLAGKVIRLFYDPVLPAHLTLRAKTVSLSELSPPSTRAPFLIPSTGNKRATRWRGVPQR